MPYAILHLDELEKKEYMTMYISVFRWGVFQCFLSYETECLHVLLDIPITKRSTPLVHIYAGDLSRMCSILIWTLTLLKSEWSEG